MQEPYPNLDRWSFLDHRIGTAAQPKVGTAPGWLPPDQWRRISAYRFLDALNKNSTRWYMEWDEDYQRDQFVEMGDPWLFGDRIAAGVVGDQIELVVDGAEHPPPSVGPIQLSQRAATKSHWLRMKPRLKFERPNPTTSSPNGSNSGPVTPI